MLDQVVRFYQRALEKSDAAKAYLAARGLDSDELREHFRLGFCDRTLGMELPHARLKAGDKVRGQLQRLGVLRDSGHERFRGSLVVPVFDENRRVVQMYGRKIGTGLRPEADLHVCMTDRTVGVWNSDGLTDEVILCKGVVDAMTLWAHGWRSVTATFGASALTSDHLAAFQRQGVGRVLIAFDSDADGDRAAMGIASELLAAGIDTLRVQLPHGEDINDVACMDLSTAETRLRRIIERAAPLHVSADGHATRASIPAASPHASAPAAAQPARRGTLVKASQEVPGPTATASADDDELLLPLGSHSWRARGLAKATTFDALRVNVMVRGIDDGPYGEGYHVDTLDLYSARQRAAFVAHASRELGASEETIRKELGTVLRRCEERADERARRAAEPVAKPVVLSADEEAEAVAFLRDPALADRIVEDYERCGIVGEETNKLVAYLTATSRLLERPLAVIVQSTSAAGKSALLDATLALLPDEVQHSYSAMTGRSLFYMAGQDLAHKVLAVAEDQGVEQAAYALKLLQSEGSVSIASTGKDAATGRFVTRDYSVSGPVALFLTTTSLDVDEELLNRCIVLSVDEDREQTRAIQRRQRQGQTLAGLLADRDRERIRRVHHNAQRLLQPLLVVNPYADRLSYADERTRTRRDHVKYLSLIRAVTLLFQYQREQKVVEHNGERLTYIEVTAGDIALANRLAHEVLGRSLDDLPPQTRRLLVALRAMVAKRAEADGLDPAAVRFSRRDALTWLGWGATQLAVHLDRLIREEHVLVHRGGRGKTFAYELLWDGSGSDGSVTLNGLVDPGTLPYDDNLTGPDRDIAAPSRPHIAPFAPPRRSDQTSGNAKPENGIGHAAEVVSSHTAPPGGTPSAAIGAV